MEWGTAWDRVTVRRWLGGYLLAAVLVFALGGLAGGLLARSVDPGTLASFPAGLPFPDELTFPAILANNLLAATVILLGVLTFGLVTAFALFFNGLLLGLVVTFAVADLGVGTTLALLLPHGVFELPALWIVGAVVFRVVHRGVRYLRRIDDALLTREEAIEAATLLGVAALLFVVAAWVEANVTAALAETVG